MKRLFIIIDAGHGIDTKGKRSPVWKDGTQLFEYDYNRKVALFLESELRELGITSLRIVTSDKDMSLSQRVRTANRFYQLHKEDKSLIVVYVSLHGNAAGVEGAYGFEIFTSIGQTESDKIATFIFESCVGLKTKMRKDTSDGDVDKESRFYVLTETDCPAVLIESGFFTNYDECQKMLDKDYQKFVAQLIAQGLLDYQTHINQ